MTAKADMDLRIHPAVNHFFVAAKKYCNLLELSQSTNVDQDIWMERIWIALAQLYATALALPKIKLAESASDPGEQFDLKSDEWQAIYHFATQTLKDARIYWVHYHPHESPRSETELDMMDLADDLADIYRDVMPALRVWETRLDEYLPEVLFTCYEILFFAHWGIHAVNALSALHPSSLLYESGAENNG